MVLRVFVQFLICLLVIPLMGGIVQAVTGKTTPAVFGSMVAMVPIVVIMLWGSNFIGRLQEDAWKQKFERESKVVLRIARPVIILSVLLGVALSRLR
jgi:hypothetical protein